MLINLICRDRHIKDPTSSSLRSIRMTILKPSSEQKEKDVQFAPMFKTEKLLALVDTLLEEIDLLDEGLVSEPELAYIYMNKNSEKKEFFRAWQRHLVHTSVIEKIIAKILKSEGSKQVKEQLIKQIV
ncbi:unnamed protein product [Lactuca virosa]|uniref:Uncharacterized protein n=1 Tax=Lactuca virosa TaxID=75947 RepID=A0AAU9PU79_9ASTR|nr:unnamed protein product [Lactuca virosa]